VSGPRRARNAPDRARRAAPAALLLFAACGPGLPAADLVLLDGAVLTMDSAQPRAEAVAIRGGAVIFVGSTEDARKRVGPSTRVVALEGKLVLPGFVDAHVHPVTGGMELGQCDLAEDETAEAIFAHLRRCVAALPDSAWLVGSSWALPVFPDAAPRKEWLDSLTGDRPAYLSAADGHSAWVNSAALRLAGVGPGTPDPGGGRIERDRRGEASGTLRESAMGLVAALVPPPTAEQRLQGLRRAVALLNRHGVTAFQEASASREILETYRDLRVRGELTARVVVAMRARPEAGWAQVDSLIAWRAEFSAPDLHPTAVKFFVDGVIEARTAAMLEPYTDQPPNRGEPNWPPALLDSMVARLVAEGFSIHMHAIGDRAVRMGLDAIERAEAPHDHPPRRGQRAHQLAHLEVIDSADVPRFAALGVIANFQPLWAYPDTYIVDLTWPGLGPARSRWLYPIGAVAAAGGTLAFGSDWNVSSLDPLRGIQVAVTRQRPGDSTGARLLPEQAITLEAALRAYTAGSARALGLGPGIGSLRVGVPADLVVVAPDPRTLPPHRIAAARVLLTLFNGQPVHGSLDSLQRR